VFDGLAVSGEFGLQSGPLDFLRKALSCSPLLPSCHPASTSQRSGPRQPHLIHIGTNRFAVYVRRLIPAAEPGLPAATKIIINNTVFISVALGPVAGVFVHARICAKTIVVDWQGVVRLDNNFKRIWFKFIVVDGSVKGYTRSTESYFGKKAIMTLPYPPSCLSLKG
jgi:hypothetical protein